MNASIAGTFVIALAATQSAYANCGPFGVFGDNDYCERCSTRAPQRVNFCPGGDFGLSAVGVANPGCSVSYWAPSCGNAALLSTEGIPDGTANNKNKLSTARLVAPGKATVSQKGGEVTIRMKREDFDKLLNVETK